MIRQFLGSVVLAVLALMLIGTSVQAREAALDFTAGAGEDAWQWLEDRNIIFERGADNKSKTELILDKDHGLIVKALKRGQSIIALKQGYLQNYRDVVIHWGVNEFPKGASYAKGKRNEAIMLQVFFGDKNISSGSFVVPDAPYFIALHLCENDEIKKPEKGRYYHDGGRFVCVAHPKPGETVETRFDLKQAFIDYYGFAAPPIYGIALEFDTNGAPNGGKTSAFVKKIEFPQATYELNQ
jgi:hypothetical protein